jgi:Thymidylate synthase complementing protein
MIKAEIVADSINYNNIRLTTLKLAYPRFIHAEFMTHRVFSRNASSSRAEPVAKHIERIKDEYAEPIHWGQNQPGMQAKAEISEETKRAARAEWWAAKEAAIAHAKKLNDLGVHKQIVNRVLEPFSYINVVVTATEWDNFFELRLHPDAQPEIRELAYQMRVAMKGSHPKPLVNGEWHLPFIDKVEKVSHPIEDLLRFSVARCARVSYLTHDKKAPNPKDDIVLFERLVGSVPIHASPTEHQATPLESTDFCRNFRGWMQYRELLEQD